jgi:predicted O-methyltransferase YrrM
VDLGHLFAHPPAIHLDDEGRPRKIAASHALLRRVADSIEPGSRTLETGIGLSTLVFAVKGAEHTCVAPFHQEIDRVKEWCAGAGVDLSKVTFCQGRSEKVLPTLPETPLDAVLIDGGHGFPAPFIDWWYAGRRLVPGGKLFVDDTQLWTGAVLRDFLAEQPEWDLVERLPMRAAVLRRAAADDPDRFDEWVHQPYVARRSWTHGWRGVARRGVRGVDLVRRRLRERS